MPYTAEELRAIRISVGTIARDRVARSGLNDPADEIATRLAVFLYDKAERWVDFTQTKGSEDLDELVRWFITQERNKKKPRRSERNLRERMEAARSGLPSALRDALILIRVEARKTPTPISVGLFSVFQAPGLYSVHWMDFQKNHHRLETHLPLSDADYRAWDRWRKSPQARR